MEKKNKIINSPTKEKKNYSCYFGIDVLVLSVCLYFVIETYYSTAQWLILIIPATWEAEIRRIEVHD
jgi:hypothetical protein